MHRKHSGCPLIKLIECCHFTKARLLVQISVVSTIGIIVLNQQHIRFCRVVSRGTSGAECDNKCEICGQVSGALKVQQLVPAPMHSTHTGVPAPDLHPSPAPSLPTGHGERR